MIVNLKQKLDYHYKAFDRIKIEPDPLQFLHKFNKEKDIEVMGFIASIFAYGSVTQIIRTLNRFLMLCKNSPHEYILNYKPENQNTLSHRFYTSDDVDLLFILLNQTYKKYGSLKDFFYSCYSEQSTIKNSISSFSKQFLSEAKELNNGITRGVKFMFPIPEKGSACKRMNLFLRWMVRKDELDFGIWDKISPSKLLVPVDTHVARISRKLKLTSRKIPSLKMAEEITNNLRKYDPVDPVKYDFALCHIGMRKLEF